MPYEQQTFYEEYNQRKRKNATMDKVKRRSTLYYVPKKYDLYI